MTVIGRNDLGGVAAAVHVDLAIGVRAADIENVEALQFLDLDDFDAIWRQKLPDRA